MSGENDYDELVMSLLESALDRSPEERAPYLRSVCRGDPALYEEVWSRVEWEQRMGGFLREPLLSPECVSPRLEAGTRLSDRFRIVREVGSGGMGVVYEAVDEKLDRRIAVKCAKLGFWNRLPPEARNAREVSHFNVCKVHDLHVTTTPLGEVDFLTMEFIDGETLAGRLKRSGKLPEGEARDIARQICAGLAQAHRQGVIHGDLKASNVLLAQSPEGGLRAVITDFGLAKLKLGDVGAHVMSERGGTIDYMAPELLRGGRASVATDLYALGVLFHVMLAGHPPRRLPEPPQTTHADSREGAQTKLDVAAETGSQREVEDLPSRWTRTITRCLEPRPEDRFDSAEQVWHALEGRRLVAKWVMAAMLALIVALLVTLWQLREKPGPPIRLAVLPFSIQGEPVPSADGIAYDVANRLSGLRRNFTVISPREATRYQVRTVQDAKSVLNATHVLEMRIQNSGKVILASAAVLDMSSGRAIRELKGDYSVDDTPLLTKALIATVTGALGLRSGISKELVSASAYPFYVQGIALVQRDGDSADQAIPYFRKAIEIDSRSALPYAGLAEAQLQKFSSGYGRQWLEQAQQAITKAKSLNADSVPVLLASGLLNQEQGFYEQAVRDISRAAEIDATSSDAWRRLATLYDRMNRPEEAIAAYQRAVAAQPGYYRHYSDFGIFYYNRGRYREAEELMRRVIELAPNLDSGHGNLGVFLMDQGRYREAEAAMLDALRLRQSLENLNNLGALYNYEGRDQEAIQFYEKSRALGRAHISLYLNLGDTYRRLGRYRESWDAYRQGKALAENEVSEDPRRSASRARLALFSARLGDTGRAEFEIGQALRMAPEDAKVMRVAALIYEVLKQRDKTMEILRSAPAAMLGELSRQPDLRELQQDSRFMELVSRKSREENAK
jgi:serine/threonine protein kinase/tetratricopeptide (TPR) repeat protein